MQPGHGRKRWRCMLLLWFRRLGGAIPGCHSGFDTATGCWWTRSGSGKNCQSFSGPKEVISGQGLALSKIVEFSQDISSSRCTFICMDALDEYPAGQRVGLLDSLNQILQKSPGARIFLTGRPHMRGEVERHLGGRAVTRSITPTENDIMIFLRAKLKADTMPDAMDESLEEEIIRNIPETVSEM